MRLRDDDELDVPAQINIVPMIDVIFAILTFFVMATLTLSRVESLPVNLPGASTAQLQQNNLDALVTIRSKGQIFVNRDEVAIENLDDRIRQIKGEQPVLLVILNVDEAVRHGQVVKVMDQLRRIEGVRVAIATKPQS